MEEETNSFSIVGIIIFIFIMLGLFIFGIYYMYNQVNGYMIYSKFCKNNIDLCYCDLFNGGSFKLSHSTSYTNGVLTNNSNNVKELCDLARKINDKQMLFDAEC